MPETFYLVDQGIPLPVVRLFVTFDEGEQPTGLTAGESYTWVGIGGDNEIAGTGLAVTSGEISGSGNEFVTDGQLDTSTTTLDGEAVIVCDFPADLVVPGSYRARYYSFDPAVAGEARALVDVEWDGAQIVTSASVTTGGSTVVEYSGAYPARGDIERVFGPSNVSRWADVENNDDPNFILERINWARYLASRRIDDRLRYGKYVVPFSSPYPAEIVDISARIAGILLYEARQFEDEGDEKTPRSAMSRHQKYVNKRIQMLLDERVTLLAMTTKTKNFPQSFVGTDPNRATCIDTLLDGQGFATRCF